VLTDQQVQRLNELRRHPFEARELFFDVREFDLSGAGREPPEASRPQR
jgi:hypothetical protein